jgi:hypothetical protein
MTLTYLMIIVLTYLVDVIAVIDHFANISNIWTWQRLLGDASQPHHVQSPPGAKHLVTFTFFLMLFANMPSSLKVAGFLDR